jgi:hypothetical protein
MDKILIEKQAQQGYLLKALTSQEGQYSTMDASDLFNAKALAIQMLQEHEEYQSIEIYEGDQLIQTITHENIPEIEQEIQQATASINKQAQQPWIDGAQYVTSIEVDNEDVTYVWRGGSIVNVHNTKGEKIDFFPVGDESSEQEPTQPEIEAAITEHMDELMETVTTAGLDKKADYEGWENQETWAVALWINNDQGLQEMVRETAIDFGDDISGFIDYLKDFVEDNNPLKDAHDLYADLMMGAIGNVDWSELARTFIDEAKEEESYQEEGGE